MTKALIWIVIIIIIIAGLYAILVNWAQFSLGAKSKTEQQQQAATTTPLLQVQAQEVTIGTGTPAVPGSLVSVLYVGRLADGTIFDSSAAHNNEPLTFVLGTQGLIPGFQIGVNGMREGGERLLKIPPEFAYGSNDVKDASSTVIIPANSTLLFNVKLLKVSEATSTATTTKKAP